MEQNTNSENQIKKKPKWFLPTILLVVVLVIGNLAIWQYNAQLEYIGGNVLNLPYITQWNDDDLLDNPWKNLQFHAGLMYRNLFLADSSFETVENDLAQSYQVSSDGLEYSITLKDDIRWSDGEALTIDDVIFSIESVLQSSTANGLYSTAFAKIEGYGEFIKNPEIGLSGLEKTNDTSLTIHLSTQHPTMIQVLAQFAILPEHALADADIPHIDNAVYWKDPVVSGMYQVGEVIPYETVQLVRNEYYTGTKPNIDEIMLHVNYKFTNLDYYSTNNITEIINYRSMRSMNEHKVDLLFYRYFVYNFESMNANETPAMDDVNVRKAIALAIDRESLLYDVYLDSGTLVESGVPSSHPSYDGQTLSYDPEKATDLLEQSDYDMSRPLRLGYYYTDATSKAFMEAVAQDLTEVGFNVELCFLSTSAELYEDREYDLLLKGLSAFDVSEWYFEYNSNANLSYLLGGNTEFNAIVEEFSATVDTKREDELLKELQEMERDNMFKIPLFTLSQVLYINEDRVDLPANCSFGNTWYKYDVDFENWSIKKE